MPRKPAYPRRTVEAFVTYARRDPENRPIPRDWPAYLATARPELTAADGTLEQPLPTTEPED